MANEEKFDVILMDIQMPILDGISATVQIRKFDILTPILGLTANADEISKQAALAAGMATLVMKPVKSVDLAMAIERAAEAIRTSFSPFNS